MDWAYLVIAGLLEAVWAVGLKYTQGFTKPLPSAITLIFMALSIFFLSLAVRALPIGTAYAVWTGIGAVLTAIAGILLFGEPYGVLRIFFILMIIIGIVGLKFAVDA